MWWLRDLLDYTATRVALVVLSTALAGWALWAAAGGGGASSAVTTTATSTTTTSTAPDGVGGVAQGPLSPGGERCREALSGMRDVVERTGSAEEMLRDAGELYEFSKAYRDATESCLYAEFVRFEQEVLIPWYGSVPPDEVADRAGAAG